jgi:hypothetical protein
MKRATSRRQAASLLELGEAAQLRDRVKKLRAAQIYEA